VTTSNALKDCPSDTPWTCKREMVSASKKRRYFRPESLSEMKNTVETEVVNEENVELTISKPGTLPELIW
jgi:hypothetical protein